MTDKPCSKCGVNPRKISSTGKQLTQCDDCQRESWRGYKPAKKPKTPKQHKAPKEHKPEPEPTPEPPKRAASKARAERMEHQLKLQLIAARFEVVRLRRLIATASSIDEIRGQL